jgi:hypothetical protein
MLLDKLAKYEQELCTLQASLTREEPESSQVLSSRGGKREFAMEKEKSVLRVVEERSEWDTQAERRSRPAKMRNSPLTIGKIIQLSTRILDMKIQLK